MRVQSLERKAIIDYWKSRAVLGPKERSHGPGTARLSRRAKAPLFRRLYNDVFPRGGYNPLNGNGFH